MKKNFNVELICLFHNLYWKQDVGNLCEGIKESLISFYRQNKQDVFHTDMFNTTFKLGERRWMWKVKGMIFFDQIHTCIYYHIFLHLCKYSCDKLSCFFLLVVFGNGNAVLIKYRPSRNCHAVIKYI